MNIEAADWAKVTLGSDAVHEYKVPMPKTNLVGVELNIVSSKPIAKNQDMVACHEIETGAYGCHQTDKLDITEVTVENEGGPQDTVWVACHEGYGCHVMNVADKAFTVAEGEFKMTNLRGDI